MGGRLTLYGRSYCHLCEDMEKALRGVQEALGFNFTVVNIDADPAAEALYDELVPVLTDADGREICHYFLDLEALRTRLAVK